jgi:GrpB-like predicted nucleotidyltransferase (UPF0157 family)
MVKIQGIFKGGPVSYEDYDADYPRVFAEVAKAIQIALPSAQVEHVGSTSIPGLGGRRVLDIVIPAEQGSHDEIVSRLLSIGFIKSPLTHMQPMLTGSIQYNGNDYPMLLYILPEDSEIYRGWIAFRTYMNQHPEEVQHYADVKKRAIAEGKTNGWTYQQAKTPYLESLVTRMPKFAPKFP